MTSIAILFESTLTAQGLELDSFYRTVADDLFPQAEYVPETLKSTTGNESRVFKCFLNSPQSNIRIFYFQMLRLCYQTGSCHTLSFLNKMKRVVLDPAFQILFSFDTEEYSSVFNNSQFKKLFAQFIDHLDNQEDPCIEESINDYPIMDVVMIHIMRSLLATRDVNPEFNTHIQTSKVFKELSSVFRVRLSEYQNYWIFEDTDLACFCQSQWEMYISYRQSREMQDRVRSTKYINKILLNKIVITPSKGSIAQRGKSALKPAKQFPRVSPLSRLGGMQSPKAVNRGNIRFQTGESNISFSGLRSPLKSQLSTAKQSKPAPDRRLNPESQRHHNCQNIQRTLSRMDSNAQSMAVLIDPNHKQNRLTRNSSFGKSIKLQTRLDFKRKDTIRPVLLIKKQSMNLY